MALFLLDGNWCMRVSTRPDENRMGITMGFSVNMEAYIKFQETFGFPVAADGDHFIYCYDDEYYRVKQIIDNYLDCKEFLSY
jgi:hypothetical protein